MGYWGNFLHNIKCRKCPIQTRALVTFLPILEFQIPSTMLPEIDSMNTCDMWAPPTRPNSPTPLSPQNLTAMERHQVWKGSLTVERDDTGTAWLTLAPNCDWVHGPSTSKDVIQTSAQLVENEQTGTESSLTARKKTPVPSNGELQDTPGPASGPQQLQPGRVLKRKNSCYVRNPGTGSSTDVTSTTPWIRCGQCKRLKRFDYKGVLQTLICQLALKNGN